MSWLRCLCVVVSGSVCDGSRACVSWFRGLSFVATVALCAATRRVIFTLVTWLPTHGDARGAFVRCATTFAASGCGYVRAGRRIAAFGCGGVWRTETCRAERQPDGRPSYFRWLASGALWLVGRNCGVSRVAR